MKRNLFKLAAIMLVLAGGFGSCDKWINEKIEEKLEKQRTTLPPETQTGANTFGCYVNEELFVRVSGSAGFGMPSLEAQYSDGVLKIWASGEKVGKYGKINLTISDPTVHVKKKLSWVSYTNHEYYKFYDTNVGEVTLTRFDLANGMVSGTFACEIASTPEAPPWLPDCDKDTVIQITQGRFDIRWLEIDGVVINPL